MKKFNFISIFILIILLSHYNVYAGQCWDRYLENHNFGFSDVYDKDAVIRDISLKKESQYYTYVKIKFSIPKEKCSITKENKKTFLDHIINIDFMDESYVSIFTEDFNISKDILNDSKKYTFTSENVPFDTGTVIIDDNSNFGKNFYDVYYLTYYKSGIDDNKFEHIIYVNQKNKTISFDSNIYSAGDVIHRNNNIYILYDNFKHILEKENIEGNIDDFIENIQDKKYIIFEKTIKQLWEESEIFYDSDNYSATIIAYDKGIGFIVNKQKMFVNGLLEQTDIVPYIQPSSNSVMLPLSTFAKTIDGISVDWDNITKTATIIKNNDRISFIVGRDMIIVNGNNKSINAVVEIKNNHIYVPLRALSEALGFQVEWDNVIKMVVLK